MVHGRFFDGDSAAAHEVEVRLTGGMLIIDGPISRVWALGMIVSAKEPVPDGRIILSVPGSYARLEIDDAATLRELAASGVHIAASVTWSVRRWLVAIVAGLACIAVAAFALTALPRWAAPIVPRSWERLLARPIEAVLETNKRACTGAAGQQALDHLAERLRLAGGIDRPVRITVLNDSLVNAFTLPGGQVVVMRGLIDQAEDGPELAGVIAHEFGHVAHYDPTAMVLRQIGLSVLASAVGLGDSDSAALSRDLLTRSYGRQAETAADAAAIETLTKAGLRADGLARFFKKLEAHETLGAGGIGWLNSHPPTEQRRQKVAHSSEGQEPFTDSEWKAIRTMCGTPAKQP